MFGGDQTPFRFNFQITDEGELEAKPTAEPQTSSPEQTLPSDDVVGGLRPAAQVQPNDFDPRLHKLIRKLSAVEQLDFGGTAVKKWTVPSQALQECLDILDAKKEEGSFQKVSDVLRTSDLAPGVYEGGFKLWEGASDLVHHVQETEKQGASYAGKKVLELGCGHGVPGIYMWKKGAEVDLQDYNAEVLGLLTIPNAILNLDGTQESLTERLGFYSGDWGLLTELLPRHAYDVILTAETIYNVQSLPRLYALIKHCLKPPHGVCYVAAKSYYFSVGGGCRQFEEMVAQDGVFDVVVEKLIKDGTSNVREIIKLSCKPSST